jgi:hypothetical protein
METLKTFWRGLSGLATFAALVLTAIGGVGYLIYDRHILFAVALIAVVAFAFKPMWQYIQKSLL